MDLITAYDWTALFATISLSLLIYIITGLIVERLFGADSWLYVFAWPIALIIEGIKYFADVYSYYREKYKQ